MCIAIYAILLALLLFYTDFYLEQYALSVSSSDEHWIVVALGWEIVPSLWPLLLLLMVASSAVTLFIARRTGKKHVASHLQEHT